LYRSGRLPLIDEYDGLCAAENVLYVPDRETLFRCCNHGYSQSSCPRFPPAEELSCLRYSVVRRTPDTLEIICVEEAEHEPLRWHKIEYLLEQSELRGDVPSECIRAQAIAFCQAYVRRLPV
jgi:hypothetical protein